MTYLLRNNKSTFGRFIIPLTFLSHFQFSLQKLRVPFPNFFQMKIQNNYSPISTIENIKKLLYNIYRKTKGKELKIYVYL